MHNQFFEIYRAGMKTAADMMTATLQGVQRVHQQQLQTLNSAIDDQVKSVRQLAETKSVDELVTLQTRLASSQVERMVDFWSHVWKSAADGQVAIIDQTQAQFGQVREALQEESERKSA